MCDHELRFKVNKNDRRFLGSLRIRTSDFDCCKCEGASKGEVRMKPKELPAPKIRTEDKKPDDGHD